MSSRVAPGESLPAAAADSSALKTLSSEQALKVLSTRKKDLERARRISTANEMLYPMHVLPVKELLKMKRGDHLHHQALVAQGKVVKWRTGMGPVAFVSHQWLGYEHADPEFEQLGCLQRVADRIRTGDLKKIETNFLTQRSFKHDAEGEGAMAFEIGHDTLFHWVDKGFIWFDYFSVPQVNKTKEAGAHEDAHEDATPAYYNQDAQDLASAVDSIPAYIEQSEFFFILCPPCFHKQSKKSTGQGKGAAINDFVSWSRRGWCRAEAVCRLLARRSGAVVRIDNSEAAPRLMPAYEAWM